MKSVIGKHIGNIFKEGELEKNSVWAKYYEALDIAHTTMNYKPFIELVSELVIESEELWLSLLG